MFGNKKKIELNNEEKRIILLSLVDFKNDLIKENKYTDIVDEVIPKLKNKMKLDKYDLGGIIAALDNNRKKLVKLNQDTSFISNLILKLIN